MQILSSTLVSDSSWMPACTPRTPHQGLGSQGTQRRAICRAHMRAPSTSPTSHWPQASQDLSSSSPKPLPCHTDHPHCLPLSLGRLDTLMVSIIL